jgi:hypothetical protein
MSTEWLVRLLEWFRSAETLPAFYVNVMPEPKAAQRVILRLCADGACIPCVFVRGDDDTEDRIAVDVVVV